MATSLRFGSALSVIALATTLGGCAGLTGKSSRASVASNSRVGLATRAQFALSSKDYASAVSYAEQAAEASPRESAVRTLLGNAYFASGRFTSAEGAYRDSLSLASNQPQVVLKLALVQIAQGRNSEAVALLNAARNAVEPSDYGLALALAGQPADAVAFLTEHARRPGADAQVRQNLALALALSGDWANARIVASQDLSPDLVDARIEQWMAFTKPTSASSQVAALVGITPDVSDPGQPVRLALNAAPPAQALAEAQPAETAPVEVAAAAAPPSPIETINVAPASQPAFAEAAAPAPIAFAAKEPAPEPAFITPSPRKAQRAPTLRASAKSGNKLPVHAAALKRSAGKSAVVVQLGAYGSAERVSVAWDKAAKRYASLRAYTPMSAKFASSKGPVYRLSVKGFDSIGEAQGLCSALRRAGGSCFVRSVAGDTPVHYAAR
ncbi:MAG TPA: tetratricopeptide repeat protein [Sphingomicrobium sp.]|nr:tetratricopeptide repeat protein [Sphingomicrobium sp.]